MMKVLWIGEHAVPCYFEGEVKCETDLIYGWYEPTTNVIYVDNTCDKQVQARTLFHEAMHAVIHLRVGKSVWSYPVDQLEESYVRALESLQDVLRDRRNAWFTKIILKRFTKDEKK